MYDYVSIIIYCCLLYNCTKGGLMRTSAVWFLREINIVAAAPRDMELMEIDVRIDLTGGKWPYYPYFRIGCMGKIHITSPRINKNNTPRPIWTR